MTSFSDYVPGSATAEYRRAVDQAAEIAEQQKQTVDPIRESFRCIAPPPVTQKTSVTPNSAIKSIM